MIFSALAVKTLDIIMNACMMNACRFALADSALPLTPISFEILLALTEGDRHGYAILQQVEARTAGLLPLRTGTLYRALARLEEAGLIDLVDGPRRRRAPSVLPHHVEGPRDRARRSEAARGPSRGGARRASCCRDRTSHDRAPLSIVPARLPAAVSRALRGRHGASIRSAAARCAGARADGIRRHRRPRPGRRRRERHARTPRP